jgi:hypothetical protein
MKGTAVRNVKMFREAVGDAAAKNVVILTTQWDRINEEDGNRRLAELENRADYFGNIVAYGATMAKSKLGDRYGHILQLILKNHEEHKHSLDGRLDHPKESEFQLQHEYAVENKRIDQTKAGRILDEDVTESLQDAYSRYERQIEDLMNQVDHRSPEDIKAMEHNLKEVIKNKRRQAKTKKDILKTRDGGRRLWSRAVRAASEKTRPERLHMSEDDAGSAHSSSSRE